tara:strand:- start:118 stop:336 length:219 start_codon:yes stop_codon:yes gene_type:complete
MRKGHLVKLKDSVGSFLDEEGPYIIVRGPYEYTAEHMVHGRKVSHLLHCVDLLMPSGRIVVAVACKALDRIT